MPTPSLPPLLQPGPFRERLIVYLLPYFMPLIDNFDVARTEILETLASYGARTRSEMINAARIVAFSASSMEVLAEAAAGEMSPELRMRYRGCANALDRSCQQIETRLTKSLARDRPAQADAAQPQADAEPANDTPEIEFGGPETEFETALQYAQAYLQTYRDRMSDERPATLPQAAFASQQHPARPPLASRDPLVQHRPEAETPARNRPSPVS